MLLSTSAPYCLRTTLWLAFLVVACCPPIAFARPTGELRRRQSSDQSNGDGGSANVWLPILIVAIVFAILTLIACIRRHTRTEQGAGAITSDNQNQPAGQAPTARPGRRRRPARTPSQISTKSLPPYMKEPGDQELVIFKGPSDMEDEPHDPMPILEEDDEHLEIRETHRNLPLDNFESHDTTLGDNSTANLMYNSSGDIAMRRSVDVASVDSSGHGSHSELLLLHSRQASDAPLGEVPPYFEVIGQDAPQTSHNDHPLPETSIQSTVPGYRRSKFSFIFNPFGGSSRHPPVSIYNRAVTPDHHGSSLSLESRTSGHRRNRSSVSGILNPFSDHSAAIAFPSTISVDSISAPLTHTLKRSEFRAPKGGLTPEQIKLITSRDALERFGAPYGPDAVAFSASRSNMVPPPDFEAAISNSLGQASRRSIDLRNTSSTGGSSSETTGSSVANATAADEAGQTASDSFISGAPAQSSSRVEGDLRSLSRPPPSSYHPYRAESRASSVTSFETAISELSPPITPITARPVTPVTARPLSH